MTSAPVLVIAGSTRGKRRSLVIAAWVAELGREVTGEVLEVVDLRELGLTMDDEPALPALGVYAGEATRRWSARVRVARALVFVTPQYNWGYPAPLKNALDHLYAEWRGKPAAIVTYGGHGGGKAAAQLRQVLEALKMRVAVASPELTLPRAGIEADDAAVDPAADFADRSGDVRSALRELLELAAG